MYPERHESQRFQVRPEDLVRGTVRLILLPEVFTRVSRMVDDPRCSGSAIAEVIGRDPVLASRLLRLANSPFYGFSSRVGTLSRAVTVIGGRGLRDLILASSFCDLFSRLGKGILDHEDFWQHSLFCGLAARLLGLRCGISETESLFVSGLMHDIGQLVLVDKVPEMARETQLRARDTGVPLYMLERSVIGCDHAEVGGELLRQWLLPATIYDAVACHHDPLRAEHAPLSAAIVHVADLIAHQFHPGPVLDGKEMLALISLQVSPRVRDLLDLDERLLQEFHEEILFQRDIVSEAMRAA